ncbi:MAG: alpha/beta hydrolase [Anaerolineaceae bacterium]|nr:alpha/beta hydrolase [Anaerolineaceae bacterium]
MPFLKVNKINIYYELHGNPEKETLVLSNGILMSTASWNYQVSELSRHFQVLVYDCRGMWQSDHPAGQYSMEQHADDLSELLSALGIERAHIAGISYGSEISMVFALKYPQQTKTLMIFDGVSQIDPLLKSFGDTWVAAAEQKNAALLLRVTTPLNFSEEWITKNEKIFPILEEKYKHLDFDAFIRLMESFFHLNITEMLPSIQVPTMVVVGEKDILKTRSYSEKIAELIPGSEFYVVPGSGHALCLEKPKEFNSLALGFVHKYADNE